MIDLGSFWTAAIVAIGMLIRDLTVWFNKKYVSPNIVEPDPVPVIVTKPVPVIPTIPPIPPSTTTSATGKTIVTLSNVQTDFSADGTGRPRAPIGSVVEMLIGFDNTTWYRVTVPWGDVVITNINPLKT